MYDIKLNNAILMRISTNLSKILYFTLSHFRFTSMSIIYQLLLILYLRCCEIRDVMLPCYWKTMVIETVPMRSRLFQIKHWKVLTKLTWLRRRWNKHVPALCLVPTYLLLPQEIPFFWFVPNTYKFITYFFCEKLLILMHFRFKKHFQFSFSKLCSIRFKLLTVRCKTCVVINSIVIAKR